MTRLPLGAASAIAICLLGAFFAFAQAKDEGPENSEQERSVKQAEVPASALEALKKIAGNASLSEFAEEIEHGHKYYEGSFKGADGNVDALVTESGDVVEIEESIPQSKVPSSIRTAAGKQAGEKLTFERKTLYLYEIHYEKDGKEHELIFTADARPYTEP